jgi:hypothetical protein
MATMGPGLRREDELLQYASRTLRNHLRDGALLGRPGVPPKSPEPRQMKATLSLVGGAVPVSHHPAAGPDMAPADQEPDPK